MDFNALAQGGDMGAPGSEDKFGALAGDPLEEDFGAPGGDLMGALTQAGYNPTPDQIAQIESILGAPGTGLETTTPEGDIGAPGAPGALGAPGAPAGAPMI